MNTGDEGIHGELLSDEMGLGKVGSLVSHYDIKADFFFLRRHL